VKILSWNANGLRAALGPARKADVQAWLAAEAPDILCIQETKIDGSLCAGLKDAFAPSLPHAHFTCCAEKKGYAGTAIFSREAPLAFSSGLGDGLHDAEGRVTTAEYPGFYVVNVCVLRGGRALRERCSCGGADRIFEVGEPGASMHRASNCAIWSGARLRLVALSPLKDRSCMHDGYTCPQPACPRGDVPS
jgi:hypothetical protein